MDSTFGGSGAIALVLAAIACGTPAASTPIDGGRDGGHDAAAPDAGLDGGSDGGMDAGGPEPVDAGADAGAPDAFVPELRWFEDLAETSGIDFDRVPAGGYDEVPDRASGGVCPIDVDGVAPIDLYFAARGGISRLYVGTGVLTWRDETFPRGLESTQDAHGCLAFDAEGDGDQDLLVTGLGSIVLWENEGGHFTDATSRLRLTLDARDMYTSAAAGDLDGDGDLDLVIGAYLRFDPSRFPPGTMCGYIHCSADIIQYAYIPSILLTRDADGGYSDRTLALAPQLALPEPTLTVAIEDIVDGGLPEIYVGNDIGYRFQDRVLAASPEGIFGDVAFDRGLATNRRGYGIDTMGWSSADINGDGFIDHVASSFESDPSAVFLCEGDFCEDRGDVVGTGPLDRTFRWGVALGDFDLDGHIDLFEATGHYHSDEEIAAIGFHGASAQRPNLLINRGDGTLRWITTPVPGDGLEQRRAQRGIAIVDLDDDGRLDVITAPAIGRPLILHNVRETGGHWLRVVLRGRAPNASAAAARVTVTAGTGSWVRDHLIGEGFLGNFDPRMHFGLPTAELAAVTVRWPNGSTTRVDRIPVDAEIVIRQP